LIKIDNEYFIHPNRFPKNVAGAFYTTGTHATPWNKPNLPLEWHGDCTACGAPEAAAPDLLSPLSKDDTDTYFIRQPVTDDEIERACKAIQSCCTEALRYGGKSHTIIKRLGNSPTCSDYIISEDGKLQLVTK